MTSPGLQGRPHIRKRAEKRWGQERNSAHITPKPRNVTDNQLFCAPIGAAWVLAVVAKVQEERVRERRVDLPDCHPG